MVITWQEWKVDNVKVEIITLFMQRGVKSVVVTYDECQVTRSGNLLGHLIY